ncbi:MAG TPA: glycoside hydrolase family 44 protein [Tepidisphaeraceae bacterium]|jgi:hypothetical protein|nr:glycoside hydrolase family 44 protein [Tepidisphaeraceae bacterium]
MKRAALQIALILSASLTAAADDAVQFKIDLSQDVHPISRYIYGANRKLEGDWAGLPLTRAGGNRWTCYNWTNNASNAGSDWQYQNDNGMGNTTTPGAAVIPSIENASENKAAIIITVPINGYVSADKNGGGDVRKSGKDYLSTRFRVEKPAKGAPFTLTPDPNSPVVYQDEFVNWVMTKYPYGKTDPQRAIFFSLDNEPDLWNSTHKEVHPEKPTYAEVIEKNIEYAKAIKNVAPKTKIFGPVNYGWQGYVRLQAAPDANNRDFQEVYLAAMHAAEKSAGKRLLDVFDIHWYPEAQGGGKRIVTPDSSPALVEARVQAPRSLWDPTYTEKSWITQSSTHGPIALLPLMQKKIDANYPSTLLAMTEYNYGGGGHISGAIAEAEVLGIFGRSNLFAAAEWPMAKDESFIAAGLKMFRDYDGKHATFGDKSVQASTSDVAATSIYASIDSSNKKRIVLVAINKTANPITAAISIGHGRGLKVAKVFQLTAESAKPHAGDSIKIADPAKWSYTMPAYSVSTIEVGE